MHIESSPSSAASSAIVASLTSLHSFLMQVRRLQPDNGEWLAPSHRSSRCELVAVSGRQRAHMHIRISADARMAAWAFVSPLQFPARLFICATIVIGIVAFAQWANALLDIARNMRPGQGRYEPDVSGRHVVVTGSPVR